MRSSLQSKLAVLIPTFFNYEKRVKVLNNYLLKNYNFKISQYEKVEFKAFPLPKLIFKNILINLNSSSIEMKVKNLKIYPKLLNIYNYENYRSNKIILKDSYGELKLNDSKMFIKYLLGFLIESLLLINAAKCKTISKFFFKIFFTFFLSEISHL